MKTIAFFVGLSVLLSLPVIADITVPGADGSDGELVRNSAGYTLIDLSKAKTGKWDDPGDGNGIYDPEKWVVVFKYSKVDLQGNWNYVYFSPHPAHPPVVWLVSEDVNIGYYTTIAMQGNDFNAKNGFALGGPGGFRGGQGGGSGVAGSAGLGLGGGNYLPPINWGNGSYAARTNCANDGATYGNARIMPLIGGSGGGGGNVPGGAGGGALLIAAQGRVDLTGNIYAYGGSGYPAGSGGAVRIVCDNFTGGGIVYANGGSGWCNNFTAFGRVRAEFNSSSFNGGSFPAISEGIAGDVAELWPPDNAPTIRVARVGQSDVPADPRASFDIAGADVKLSTKETQTFELEAQNVPTDWKVVVRFVPKYGENFSKEATLKSGDSSHSIWTCQTELPSGGVVVQARAYRPD